MIYFSVYILYSKQTEYIICFEQIKETKKVNRAQNEREKKRKNIKTNQ